MVVLIGVSGFAALYPGYGAKKTPAKAGVFIAVIAQTDYQIFTRSSGLRYSFAPSLILKVSYHASMLRTVSARQRAGEWPPPITCARNDSSRRFARHACYPYAPIAGKFDRLEMGNRGGAGKVWSSPRNLCQGVRRKCGRGGMVYATDL